MAKNEALDLKRPVPRRPHHSGVTSVPASRIAWKPHFLRTQEPAVHEPRVVPIYWDPHFQKTPADVTIFDEFLRTLFRSSWMTALADHGVAPARLMPSFVPQQAPYASLSQTQLEAQLTEWLASGAIQPRPGKAERSLLYLVLTPRATKLTLGSLTSSKDFSGYHDCTAFEQRSAANGESSMNLFYVAVPLTTTGREILDAHSLSISKQLADAFIDRSHWLGDVDHSLSAKRRVLRAV